MNPQSEAPTTCDFKVGDRVELTSAPFACNEDIIGQIGTIKNIVKAPVGGEDIAHVVMDNYFNKATKRNGYIGASISRLKLLPEQEPMADQEPMLAVGTYVEFIAEPGGTPYPLFGRTGTIERHIGGNSYAVHMHTPHNADRWASSRNKFEVIGEATTTTVARFALGDNVTMIANDRLQTFALGTKYGVVSKVFPDKSYLVDFGERKEIPVQENNLIMDNGRRFKPGDHIYVNSQNENDTENHVIVGKLGLVIHDNAAHEFGEYTIIVDDDFDDMWEVYDCELSKAPSISTRHILNIGDKVFIHRNSFDCPGTVTGRLNSDCKYAVLPDRINNGPNADKRYFFFNAANLTLIERAESETEQETPSKKLLEVPIDPKIIETIKEAAQASSAAMTANSFSAPTRELGSYQLEDIPAEFRTPNNTDLHGTRVINDFFADPNVINVLFYFKISVTNSHLAYTEGMTHERREALLRWWAHHNIDKTYRRPA